MRIQSRGEISLSPIYIQFILDATVHLCLARASEKDISIDVECEENLSTKINPNLIEQAIINLLTNALTYTLHTVQLLLNHIPVKLQRLLIVISVQDQDAGIAKVHIDRFFERFYRCDKGRKKEQDGTGLELSIVKHIAMPTVARFPLRANQIRVQPLQSQSPDTWTCRCCNRSQFFIDWI